jgi:PAS domain S-box-containing protein
MLSEHSSPADSQEHSRLLKALRESELLRELSELLASSLDPTRILQVLVKRTTEVCDVERCTVWLLNETGTSFLPAAYHFSTPTPKQKVRQSVERMWHQSAIPFDNPLIQRILAEKGMLFLEDLQATSNLQNIAKNFHVRSVLLVAFIRENRPVGMMSLDKPGQFATFTHEQQQLARAIGQQAAVAIDNARLYQEAKEERERGERLVEQAQSIYQVAMAANSGEELPQIMAIAEHHLRCILGAQSATIFLLEKDSLTSAQTVHSSAEGVSDEKRQSLTDLSYCQSAIRANTPQFVTQKQLLGAELEWFQQLGMKNILIIPFVVGTQQADHSAKSKTSAHSSHCVGFAFVNYPDTAYRPGPWHYAFARDIAAQCGLAIEKARILSEARQAVGLANERANTLAAVFNAMTEGLIVLDLQGKVILTNNTVSRYISLKQNARKQRVTFPQQMAYTLNGQPLASEDFPLNRALRGERIRGERFVSKRADGSEYAIEVNIAPLLDNDENKIGIVSAFRDITEQVRVERRIRRALDTMLHAAEAVSGVTDIREILYRVLAMTLTAMNSDRGVVQLYDQEKHLFTPLLSIGFTLEDVEQWLAEQKPWFSPEENQRPDFYVQLLEGHATLVSEERDLDQPGYVQQTLVLAAPITHNKQLLGIMMLDRSSVYRREIDPQRPGATMPLPALEFNAWDMAVIEGIAQFAGLAIEQTRWQQEAEIARTNEATMRESNALKDEFLAITAHEFRTPLTIILAHGQMMSRLLRKATDVAPKLKERQFESISIIEEQTRQLTNIVNTFLEVTRLNRGQINLTNEILNLEDIVKETVTQHSATSTIHRINYKVELAEQPYLVHGDKARLQQIFANLLQNAIKYSPHSGPIRIKLIQSISSEGEKFIEATVEDRGIGIPKDAQMHLFERFYRAPNAGNSQVRGVGLGLYVVAEFLRLHGGTIRVESSGVVGEGSRFILTLPLVEEDTDADERTS